MPPKGLMAVKPPPNQNFKQRTPKKADKNRVASMLAGQPVELKAAIAGYHEMFLKSQKTKYTRRVSKTRLEDLHPSSFPFCPMFKTLDLLENGYVTEHEQETFGGQIFTRIGTEFHEVVQQALCQAHLHEFASDEYILIGDHRCLNDKCKHVHRFSSYPKKCEKCKQTSDGFFYDELAVWFKGHTITGHSDGLLLCKSTGKYWVIDFKTTSMTNIIKHNETGNKFPYMSNKNQIKSYCALFELNRDIEIEGWMLMYHSRDNPFRPAVVGHVMSRKEMAREKKRVKKYAKGWKVIRQLHTQKTKKGLWDIIDQAHALKSCKSEADYPTTMKGEYFDCPMAEGGLCWDDKKRNKHLKAVIKGSTQLIDIKELK